MTFRKSFLLSCASVLAMASVPAHAQEVGKLGHNVFLAQAFEYIDGLASANLADNVTFAPQRESDMRSNTLAAWQGLYGIDAGKTLDFSYAFEATNYFDETAFNYVAHTAGAGYTAQVNDTSVASIRGDISRSYAGTDYDGYYWRAHTSAAYAKSYDEQMSVVYGLDVFRYVFDNVNSLNATQTQISMTPTYQFQDAPATLMVIIRGTSSNAEDNSNSYKSFEILPRLTYGMGEGQYLQVDGQIRSAGFDEADPVQGIKRDDISYGGGATYYLPVADTPAFGNMMGYAKYAYTRNDSNIDRQDYDSSIMSLGLSTRF